MGNYFKLSVFDKGTTACLFCSPSLSWLAPLTAVLVYQQEWEAVALPERHHSSAAAVDFSVFPDSGHLQFSKETRCMISWFFEVVVTDF